MLSDVSDGHLLQGHEVRTWRNAKSKSAEP